MFGVSGQAMKSEMNHTLVARELNSGWAIECCVKRQLH